MTVQREHAADDDAESRASALERLIASLGDGSFSKFRWIDAVSADARIPIGERYVLVSLPLWWVSGPGGANFAVKQTTVAERIQVSVRHVQRAVARACELGWLILDEERQRGRGNHTVDRYRLAAPTVIGDNVTPIRKADSVTPITEIGDSLSERPDSLSERPDSLSEIPDRADAVTSENDTPTGITYGSQLRVLPLRGGSPPPTADHTCAATSADVRAAAEIILRKLQRSRRVVSRSELRTGIRRSSRDDTNRLRRAVPAALDLLIETGLIHEGEHYSSRDARRPGKFYVFAEEGIV